MIITGGKIYDRCQGCGALVQLNKPIIGGLHFCASACERAGEHLDVQQVTRGLIFKRTYLVCRSCGREERQ